MKILYFTRGQSPHDLRFMNALANTGHQTSVLCLEEVDHREWPDGIQVLHWPEAIKTQRDPSPGSLAQAFKRIAIKYQPDIVQAGPVQRVAYIAALAHVHPLLTMSWGSDLLLEVDQHPTWPRITRFTLKNSDCLAADCQTVVKKAQYFGYQGPVAVFPWGVDLEHFKPGSMSSLRKQLGWEKKRVFLSNRTMEPLYGVDIIAHAFSRAMKQNDDLRLLMYGKGSQEPQIREILKNANESGKVHFGGFVELRDLPDIYRSADIYLSASHSDGSSVSLMEALACGKPALISDIPSNKEWIEPGRQGWLFKDSDADELVQKMLAAAALDSYAQLSQNARRLAEERADWTKNFGILLETYQKIAAN
jgi:glycosyltransferase involved in cell wall biosynthesis